VLVTVDVVLSLLILSTLKMEATCSYETSILARLTRQTANVPVTLVSAIQFAFHICNIFAAAAAMSSRQPLKEAFLSSLVIA
jgi:hypothetical protein